MTLSHNFRLNSLQILISLTYLEKKIRGSGLVESCEECKEWVKCPCRGPLPWEEELIDTREDCLCLPWQNIDKEKLKDMDWMKKNTTCRICPETGIPPPKPKPKPKGESSVKNLPRISKTSFMR